MQVEYQDGTNKRFEAETESELIKQLQQEIKDPLFKAAHVRKGSQTSGEMGNNRAARRKNGYTNNQTRRTSYRGRR